MKLKFNSAKYKRAFVCVLGGGIYVQLVEFYISPRDLFLSVYSWTSNFMGEKLLALQISSEDT